VGVLTTVCNFFMRGIRERGPDLFFLVFSDVTWGNGLKLCLGKFR